MHENERKVFEALGDSQWDWRTLPGLEQATGLPRSAILEILSAHHSKVEAESAPDHGMIFRLKDHREDRTVIERTLEYMSLGARR